MVKMGQCLTGCWPGHSHFGEGFNIMNMNIEGALKVRFRSL